MNNTAPKIIRYIATIVVLSTIGMIVSVLILILIGNRIGFGSQGVLVMILVAFPVVQFSSLHGFYKGLVKHYGLKL